MKKYAVVAALTLAAGTVVGLTSAQADLRAHNLKPVEPHDKKADLGKYEAVAPIQFKVGETIYTDAELNKGLAQLLEPAEVHQVKAKAQAQAAAESKDLAAVKAKAKKLEAELADARKAIAERDATIEGLNVRVGEFDTTKELDAAIAAAREKAAAFDTLPEDLRSQALAALAGKAKG